MPKYPMHTKFIEIMDIANLFWIPKARPTVAIPTSPKSKATPALLASLLNIVAPLKQTL